MPTNSSKDITDIRTVAKGLSRARLQAPTIWIPSSLPPEKEDGRQFRGDLHTLKVMASRLGLREATSEAHHDLNTLLQEDSDSERVKDECYPRRRIHLPEASDFLGCPPTQQGFTPPITVLKVASPRGLPGVLSMQSGSLRIEYDPRISHFSNLVKLELNPGITGDVEALQTW